MYQTIEVDSAFPVDTIWLNRPEVRNAFNALMIEELTHCFRARVPRTDIRAIVIRGRGPAFCAGADARWMQASLEYTRKENVEDARRMSHMFSAIDEAPQPVISCVHGPCLGGGMGLIAVSDIVIAASDALFGFTEARLGIIPAVISQFVVPKVGSSWCRALFTTAERFGPEVAVRTGLVHWITSPHQLDALLNEKIQNLVNSGPMAVRAAKSLVRDVTESDRATVHDLVTERIAELRTSAEGQEGLRAFLAKRRPGWQSS
ncbi:MAG: enoyl-CoA hydratase-related protein [Chloroflexota bacterium]